MDRQGTMIWLENKYPVLKNTWQTLIIETDQCHADFSNYTLDYAIKLIQFSLEKWQLVKNMEVSHIWKKPPLSQFHRISVTFQPPCEAFVPDCPYLTLFRYNTQSQFLLLSITTATSSKEPPIGAWFWFPLLFIVNAVFNFYSSYIWDFHFSSSLLQDAFNFRLNYVIFHYLFIFMFGAYTAEHFDDVKNWLSHHENILYDNLPHIIDKIPYYIYFFYIALCIQQILEH